MYDGFFVKCVERELSKINRRVDDLYISTLNSSNERYVYFNFSAKESFEHLDQNNIYFELCFNENISD